MKEFWMRRRIISLLFAVLLLLPGAFSMADSKPSATITFDDVRGNVGDTVTATLNIDIVTTKVGQAMDSIQFILTYDSAALEFVDIKELSQNSIQILGADYICNVNSKTGKVAFAAASADGATGSGVMMHVRFKILSAASTVLTLRNFGYSFVTQSGTQDRYQGGIVNLGRITGQSVPTTIAPASPASTDPLGTQAPTNTSVPTNEPRFPVTEITAAPGANPTEAPEKSDNDVLAYIVFVLFIVVAILICVVLTLMIVRRGKNKARVDYYEDDEDDEPEPLMEPAEKRHNKGKRSKKMDIEDEEEEMPIHIVRRKKK
jgi:hypothetical protein